MSKIKLVAKIMWLFCCGVEYDGLLACGQVAHSFLNGHLQLLRDKWHS